jgi:hypothetical protein
LIREQVATPGIEPVFGGRTQTMVRSLVPQRGTGTDTASAQFTAPCALRPLLFARGVARKTLQEGDGPHLQNYLTEVQDDARLVFRYLGNRSCVVETESRAMSRSRSPVDYNSKTSKLRVALASVSLSKIVITIRTRSPLDAARPTTSQHHKAFLFWERFTVFSCCRLRG